MQTTYETAPSLDNGKKPREGKVARTLEKATSKIPSDVFLWGAGAAMAGSLAMQILGSLRGTRKKRAMARAPLSMFIGQWVPTILLIGVYNKIVKVAGSDRTER